ncbi:hypothetical protein COOONC_24674 [Cooperia oncophora]
MKDEESLFSSRDPVSLLAFLHHENHASVRCLSEKYGSDFALNSPDISKLDYEGLDAHFSNIDLTLFEQYDSMDDMHRRFCRIVYDALTLFTMLVQKKRLFMNLEAPLRSSLHKKVCFDVDRHFEEVFLNLERRLGKQASLKRLHLYLRKKFNSKPGLPTLEDPFWYQAPCGFRQG